MENYMKNKVAICQTAIMPGGRLRVLLGIVEALNAQGIEPDIFTFKLTFPPDEIEKIYGKSPRFKFRVLPYIRLQPEFQIIFFNLMLKYFASDYDLIINTSNSLIYLPEEKKVISYVFYPRESRVNADAYSIHNPENIIPRFSIEYFVRLLLRRIYRGSRIQPSHDIVCMTEFTRFALEKVYPIPPSTLPVIYPPVEVGVFEPEHRSRRSKQIVTIGRFTPDKRQFEQIQLAAQLPEFDFHIIGFVASKKYYKKCELLIKDLNLKNVYLHPNIAFNQMAQIMHQSRYFLHTLIDEPFGITAVQAIAAGCMPIVHNSGGQREVVPYTTLRYGNMDEIPGLIGALERQGDNSFDALLDELLLHVKSHFTEGIFHDRITQVLNVKNILLGSLTMSY